MSLFESYPPSSMVLSLVAACAMVIGGLELTVGVVVGVVIGLACRWLDTFGL